MPFAESMISALKSNKVIMLDKSRRFRKIKGSYDWSKNTLRNLPKATEQDLDEIREKVKKENTKIKTMHTVLFLVILIAVSIAFLYVLS